MDANVSATRFPGPMSFDPNGTARPPYPPPPPHLVHHQHSQAAPPMNPFVMANNQRFDANWFANFPPPPPPPPHAFPHGMVPSPFDPSSAPVYPQIPFLPPNNPSPPQNAAPPSQNVRERAPTPSKERAKEAIVSLVRADITFGDLVNEGIKAVLLTSLFTELNLPLPKPAEPIVAPMQELDPAMERKDRIARLLAAKKNQGSAAASPKESVQSTEPAITPETVSRNPTPSTNAVKPVMRETQASDFSIPGLFMTSAEQEEFLPVKPSGGAINRKEETGYAKSDTHTISKSPAADTIPLPIVELSLPLPARADVTPTKPLQSPPRNLSNMSKSLKRGPEPFSTSIMPRPKRQLSTSQDTPPIDDSAKVTEVGANAVRSKVNQNILKDRMAALKADLMMKNSRKKALQDGMPVLNAELQKTRERLQENQSQLQQVRTEIEHRNTELDQLRDHEARLLKDIERLENHLADAENGQQQFSHELTQLDDQIMANENESRASQASALLASSPAPQTAVDQLHPYFQNTQTLPASSRSKSDSVRPHLDEEPYSASEATAEAKVDSQKTDTEYNPEQDDVDTQLNIEAAYTTQPSATDASDRYDSFNDVPSQQVSAMATPYEVESDRETDDERMSIDEASDEDNIGSASMSDSGSEEYEPPVNVDSPGEADEKDIEDYEPHETVNLTESSPDDMENDDYEPSEQVDALNVDNLETLRRDEESSATRQSIDLVPEDTSNGTYSLPTPPAADVVATLSSSGLQTSKISTPEALEDQPPAMIFSEPLSNPRDSTSSATPFMPYSSPLSNMRQFRFNPQFNDVVKNGYRSLTYSHQIDKDMPLCPTELENGVCVDGDCEEQHFSRFALSDDKILVQMSSANHIKDKSQRDGYLIGLKKVIADLRERGVKEFSEVANALAKYRRDQALSQNGLFA